ncbi:hypothetical protein HY605_02975 [Candidatus Peregrinibacteria bacterium]|nr:hypothetical protein [Candidatus Peregrinibacteria bacterium]
MVGAFAVSNEMLYELLKDFKADVHRRFDSVDVKIEDFKEDNRYEHGKMNEKLDEVHRSKDRMTVNFTGTWVFASFMIAIFSSATSLVLFRLF